MESAAAQFLKTQPLIPEGVSSQKYTELSTYLSNYITYVLTRTIIGPEAYEHPELTKLFLTFTTDTDTAIGIGTMFPSWLRWLAKFKINPSYTKFRRILVPIIKERRKSPEADTSGLLSFLPFILDVVEDDKHVSGKSHLRPSSQDTY